MAQYQADQDSTGGSYGTGTPNVFSSVTTLDAIGEVKVLVEQHQAEYAGNGGPIVQVVTRRPRYRYNVFGGFLEPTFIA